MKIYALIHCTGLLFIIGNACKKRDPATSASGDVSAPGLKIAYVNGDTILHKFAAFKKQEEAMEAKKRKAEDQLQAKGAALEKEIMAYQQKAQSGVLTGKEMEAREKYLGSRQEAILAERDKMAKEILEESEQINTKLQDVLHSKLNLIKDRDGYDFILNSAYGGSVLAANEKYDITEEVLKMLNEDKDLNIAADTTGK
jgi:outer membrane protein